MKRLIYFLIIIIVAIAMYGVAPLIKDQWNFGGICPKLFGMPACYIIEINLILALISHLFSFKFAQRLFYIAVLISIALASYGSLGELFGFAKCPKTSNGIPMCYISWLIFMSLGILKTIEIRLLKPQV